MTLFDIAVIGAGPSGASTAFYAARAGLKVALLDKASFPRDKACGGLLTPRALTNLPGLEPYIKPVIESISRRVNLYSPSGRWMVDYGFGENSPSNIRRVDFDYAIVKAAKEAGAELIEKTRVTKIKVNSISDSGGEDIGPEACLIVKGPEGESEVKAKLLIGADGPLGLSASYLRSRENIAPWHDGQMGTAVMWEPTVGAEFIEQAYGSERKLLVHFKPENMDGYAWVFPKAETLNIGFGGYNRDMKAMSLKETFNRYVELLRREGYYPSDKPVPKHKGAPLPLAGPIKKSYTDGLMLVGDAAGLVSPLSGEGLFYGMRSGLLAAETAAAALKAGDASAASLAPYEQAWRAEFHREFKDLAFFAWAAIRWPDLLVYYGTRDDKLKAMFADLFLGLTAGGLSKWKVIPRVLRDALLYRWVPRGG